MNRALWFAVVLTGLALAPRGYAEKTRVDPFNVKLLGEQASSLRLVGVQSDGQFIVRGDFDIIDGRVHKDFARITADGRLDTAWGSTNAYLSLVMDGDDVYAKWEGGAGKRNIARLNEYGAVETNWVYMTTNDIAIVGVNSTGVFVAEGASLIKINKQSGTADWSYALTNSSFFDALWVEKNKVYIADAGSVTQLDAASGTRDWFESIGSGGWVTSMASDGVSLYFAYIYSGYYVSRISIASGVLDTNWLCEIKGVDLLDCFSLAVDDTGVYVGSSFTQINGVARSGLAKIDKTNALAIADWDVGVPGLSLQPFQTNDTSIYAIGSAGASYLARIDKTTAAIDWALPLNGYDPINIVLIGTSVFLSAQKSNSIACFAKFDKTTGAMQAFLGEHPSYDRVNRGRAYCLARHTDGKIYIGGNFFTVNDSPRSGLVRLNADESVDDTWKCDIELYDPYRESYLIRKVQAIMVDDTGLYLGLDYYTYSCASTCIFTDRIVRKVTISSGTVVTNWEYELGKGDLTWTYAIALDAEFLYVGNIFESQSDYGYYDGVVKLNKMTGEVDSRWNSEEYESHYGYRRGSALVVDGDSVYIGGRFSEIGGRRRNHVAKLDKISGRADATWNAQWPFSKSLTIGAIAVDKTSVYIGGYITDAEYRRYGGIAKLDKVTGRADPAWYCTADGSVDCLAIDGGWLYTGGGFQTISGSARTHVARLNKSMGEADPKWIHNTDGDVAALLITNGVCYLAGSFTKIGLQDHIGFAVILPASAATPGDYDGDQIADLALYNPSTGQWLIKLSSVENTPGNFSMTSGSSWIPVRGDFDGDGRTDPTLYSPDLGQFVVMASASDYHEYSVSLGFSNCVPVPGDYDNDGTTDFMVYLPERGLWTGLLSSSVFSPVALPVLGGPGWTPLTGDFNGDGSCDPAVYNETTGQWRVLDSSRNYLEIDLALTLGGFGFQAVSGDFDGDGLGDFAVYSPDLGEWDIALSALGYTTVSGIFGGEGYTPIPGDYDGDRMTDIGLYSASQGQGIAILSSRLGEQVQIPLGGPGYRPCNP